MSFWRNLSSDFHPGSVPEGWEHSQSLLEPPGIRCRIDPILPIWGGLEIKQETPFKSEYGMLRHSLGTLEGE